MRRVVLDTNVVVSALLFGGPPATLYRLAITGQIIAVTSPVLLGELHGVLLSKFAFPPDMAALIVTECQALSVVVEPTVKVAIVHDDVSDNRVLECAASAEARGSASSRASRSARADAIVSGDRHLLALRAFRGIPILTPRAFLDRQAR